MNGIKGVIWDLGGVIVKDNMAPAFTLNGIPYDTRIKEAWKRLRVGQIDHDAFFREALGDTYAHLSDRVRRTADDLIQLQPEGAFPLVEEVHGLGEYKQGIISNHSVQWGRAVVDKWDLRRYVNPIVISGEVGIDKSDERIFRYTVERMGLSPEEAVFVDNQDNNTRVAERAGLKAILFKSYTQARVELSQYIKFR